MSWMKRSKLNNGSLFNGPVIKNSKKKREY